MTTTLTGLSTIRAFDAKPVFEVQFSRYQNDNTSAYFMFICTARAFGVLMDWICVLYIAAVVVYIMLTPDGQSKLVSFAPFSGDFSFSSLIPSRYAWWKRRSYTFIR